MTTGYRMDFVGAEITQHMNIHEKIELLMQKILDNVIVVLQDPLTASERAELIKQVMFQIDHTFFGVELLSLRQTEKRTSLWWKKEEKGLTIIAPSNLVEILSHERNSLCLLLGDPTLSTSGPISQY